jgi:hypothetical protein
MIQWTGCHTEISFPRGRLQLRRWHIFATIFNRLNGYSKLFTKRLVATYKSINKEKTIEQNTSLLNAFKSYRRLSSVTSFRHRLEQWAGCLTVINFPRGRLQFRRWHGGRILFKCSAISTQDLSTCILYACFTPPTSSQNMLMHYPAAFRQSHPPTGSSIIR